MIVSGSNREAQSSFVVGESEQEGDFRVEEVRR